MGPYRITSELLRNSNVIILAPKGNSPTSGDNQGKIKSKSCLHHFSVRQFLAFVVKLYLRDCTLFIGGTGQEIKHTGQRLFCEDKHREQQLFFNTYIRDKDFFDIKRTVQGVVGGCIYQGKMLFY